MSIEVPFISKKGQGKTEKPTQGVPYDQFIKTHQDWVPKKGQKLDEKDISEFNKWHAEF
jgi:hypothetical protein